MCIVWEEGLVIHWYINRRSSTGGRASYSLVHKSEVQYGRRG